MRLTDPFHKRFIRKTYTKLCGIQVLLNQAVPRREKLAVYYGGARQGDFGGPLVKVKRLQEYFPEVRWGFNLAYLLSNAPYLHAVSLQILKRRRIPIVLNQNGVYYPAWYNGNWKRQNSIMAVAYHRADYVFWQSDFCRTAANRFLGERQGYGEVLFNAVDVRRFHPALGHRDRPFTLLLTGKIGRHLGYRVESTIAGLAHARTAGLDARLVIAGWVEDTRATRSIAERYGVADSVTLTGPYTQEQAPSIYQCADAYVMTKYLDPCPNTVLEALACGLPVLYSDNGGVPELVGSDAGVGLPVPEDWERVHVPTATAIGEGMLRIFTALPAMSVAARNRAVERFDIATWIDRHAAVFDALLERRS